MSVLSLLAPLCLPLSACPSLLAPLCQYRINSSFGADSTWGPAATDAVGANPHLATLVFCTFGIVRGIASIVGPYISTTLFETHAAQEQ